jgi:hypothetical protein
MQVIAAPYEHDMITSDPQEIEKMKRQGLLQEEEEEEDVKDQQNPSIDVEQNLYAQTAEDIVQEEPVAKAPTSSEKAATISKQSK